VVEAEWFEYFILSIIILNLFVFCAHTHRQNPIFDDVFAVINYVFMFIFIIEGVLKLLCLGKSYFKDPWNNFDMTIMVMSGTSVLLTKLKIINLGSRASLLRILRLGRLLRLIHRAETLRMIFDTFLITLPSLANIGLLLMLV
jgi:hypothetical protein